MTYFKPDFRLCNIALYKGKCSHLIYYERMVLLDIAATVTEAPTE